MRDLSLRLLNVIVNGLEFDPSPKEVAPYLDQGALAWAATRGAAVAGDYDLVVCCAHDVEMPVLPRGVAHYHMKLKDEPEITEAEFAKVCKAAHLVHLARRRGKRVLVACAMGLNRSGLVTGVSLRLAGLTGHQAVHAIRSARGKNALSNPLYAKIVEEFEPARTWAAR